VDEVNKAFRSYPQYYSNLGFPLDEEGILAHDAELAKVVRWVVDRVGVDSTVLTSLPSFSFPAVKTSSDALGIKMRGALRPIDLLRNGNLITGGLSQVVDLIDDGGAIPDFLLLYALDSRMFLNAYKMFDDMRLGPYHMVDLVRYAAVRFDLPVFAQATGVVDMFMNFFSIPNIGKARDTGRVLSSRYVRMVSGCSDTLEASYVNAVVMGTMHLVRSTPESGWPLVRRAFYEILLQSSMWDSGSDIHKQYLDGVPLPVVFENAVMGDWL
jgi:hypothetical protein